MTNRISISPGHKLVGISGGMLAAALALSGAIVLSGCGAADAGASAPAAVASQSASAAGVETSNASAEAADSASAQGSSTSGAASDPSGQSSASAQSSAASASKTALSKEDVQVNETIENSEDGGHAIEVDGATEERANVKVVKTGEAEGDEADFYGENAAVFATNGATLTLSDTVVESDGTHANGVFSYGEGTTVNVADSYIETTGNCSGGLMTTGGAAMNATNLTIHTTGNSSAAIRSDRGGGTVTVNGGSYTTDGKGSPAIYSTADVTVNDAALTSTASQGVVVEGKNSVTLNGVELTADNNTKNSDKSDYYQAVMIYQSMSGDAAAGEASFTAKDGSIDNANGDIFFVNNTVATIDLEGTTITNADADGVFLRAAAAGWGKEGSNGGHVTLNAVGQTIDGDMVVDEVSSLNLYLKDGSTFNGAVNPDGVAGDVYVELSGGAKWVLTSDSNIKSLTCNADSIDLNGHVLTVDGKAYEEGSASKGEAIEVEVSSSGNGSSEGSAPDGGGHDGAPDGKPGEPPSGEKPSGEAPDGGPGGPDGSGGPGGEPPSGEPPAGGKPDGAPDGAPDGKPGEPPSDESSNG